MDITKTLTLLFIALTFISCDKQKAINELTTGIWRGEIIAQENKIPFNFEVLKTKNNYTIILINGEEVLPIDEVRIKDDSLFFNMHIFDISVKAKIEDNSLTGSYSKNFAKDYILPFKAVYGKENRFDNMKSESNFDGTWETTFTSDDGKEIPAIGIFETEHNKLKGTFLTKTGDYRFLDGFARNDTMHLYTFDGDHIYKFMAVKKNDSILKGQFWSGKTGYKTFVSIKNPKAKLPDPNELTFLKDGYDKISFSFQGLDGKPVTLTDKKYKNKVILLQIFGTWCPNCMDETRFLSKWYNRNKDRGVEILGLAYEHKKNGKVDLQYSISRVEKMKSKYKVKYDFAIAGTSNTKSASESLPMLSKVISFPTTIFIDKKGTVRRIHSGFSGPATGKYYDEFIDEFNIFMNKLLEEE